MSNFQRQKLTLGFTLINLSFSYMTKKLGQQSKTVKNKKNFWDEIKNIFYYF